MTPIFDIALRCANGHTQTIRVEGMTRVMVEDYAALVAGRSRFFVAPIPDDAVGSEIDLVGFCTCRARIAPPVVTEVS